MPVRVVTLPNQRQVRLGEYVRSWRALLGMDPRATIHGFDYFPSEAGAVLRELRRGMDDRINRHLPWFGLGRKWDHNWQREMIQAAQWINMPRVVIDWLPKDLAQRFAHRLRRNREE